MLHLNEFAAELEARPNDRTEWLPCRVVGIVADDEDERFICLYTAEDGLLYPTVAARVRVPAAA